MGRPLKCQVGIVKGVADAYWVGSWHREGHHYGSMLKKNSPGKFNSVSFLFKDISPLARLSRDEAFAEGYII